MRTKLFIALICLLSINILNAQDYYWSANKKHYLNNVEGKFYEKTNSSMDKIVYAKEDKIIKKTNYIQVKSLGDNELIFTGEILLKPKNNVKIKDIITFVDNRISIQSKSKYNTYVMNVFNYDSLFIYANKIYESGLVEYCHPNFIASMELAYIEEDPLYEQQYYLHNSNGLDINVEDAWKISTNQNGVRIGVLDCGVEPHEDLENRVL